jgi:PhzF family phenazine biosynthesis protein
MKIPIYQVDAFTSTLFKGNPAAICPLQSWLPAETMQKIAAENNLSETAFFVKDGADYALRWFTPKGEVDLCGHATLASAFVVFTYLEPALRRVSFHTMSGALEVTKEGSLLAMVFPSREGQPCAAPEALVKGLGKQPAEVYLARDYMAVYASEEDILNLQPNMDELRKLDAFGVIATARGKEADFVSRFFAPKAGVDEDPVTGSAHCTLVPYWRKKLGKSEFIARQLSERGGELRCNDLGDSVRMAGETVPYLEGFINI